MREKALDSEDTNEKDVGDCFYSVVWYRILLSMHKMCYV